MVDPVSKAARSKVMKDIIKNTPGMEETVHAMKAGQQAVRDAGNSLNPAAAAADDVYQAGWKGVGEVGVSLLFFSLLSSVFARTRENKC